jgi:hypothetical protein
MPPKAKAFITCVIALGLGLLFDALSAGWQCADPARFLAFASLTCILSTWKIRLPGMQGTISVNFLFVLIATATLSLQETLIVSCLSALVQCTWKAKRSPRLVQVLFNISALILSVEVCYRLPRAFTDDASQPGFLVLAASLYFVVNTSIVSYVLSLIENRRFLELWENCQLWTFPYYVAGALVAALISATARSIGWQPSLLPLAMMYPLYTFYRVYVRDRQSKVQA